MAFTFGLIDKSKELDGAWIEGEDGTSFKIARWGNEVQQKLVQDERKRLGKRSLDQMPPRKAVAFMCRLICDAILLDWQGVKDVDGKDVKYTPDKALEWLSADDEFRNWIQAEAENEEHFYRERVAEAKNS